MTDQQKDAIKILNRFKDSMTNEEYFMLMEFIVENKTETQYVPVLPAPWTSPDIRPFYGDDGNLKPPYHVTCNGEDTNLK